MHVHLENMIKNLIYIKHCFYCYTHIHTELYYVWACSQNVRLHLLAIEFDDIWQAFFFGALDIPSQQWSTLPEKKKEKKKKEKKRKEKKRKEKKRKEKKARNLERSVTGYAGVWKEILKFEAKLCLNICCQYLHDQ